jgi:hypothetical protein
VTLIVSLFNIRVVGYRIKEYAPFAFTVAGRTLVSIIMNPPFVKFDLLSTTGSKSISKNVSLMFGCVLFCIIKNFNFGLYIIKIVLGKEISPTENKIIIYII